MDGIVTLQLSEAELRLVLKMVEANDTGMLDRRGRLGVLRVRTSLAHKLYASMDEIGSTSNDDEEDPS